MVMPTLYIPHGGGPCFFMEWDPPHVWDLMGDWLRGLAATLPARPRAILMISAHWEAPEFTLGSSAMPPLIYDYYGFPDHTYKLQYPAPGAPALAQEIQKLLEISAIKTAADAERGFDHGMFIPLKLIYPDANIPTVQLSLKAGLSPAAHIAAGKALAPLRGQGVLIIGSGMSYHNLRGFGPEFSAVSDRFDGWLESAATAPEEQRSQTLMAWETAPDARICHPREEHLLPLMVAAGASGKDRGRKIFSDRVMGTTVSAYRFG